jgi:chromosome segregation ATPase
MTAPKSHEPPRGFFITEFPNINNQMIPFHAFGSKEKALDDAGRSGRVVEAIEKSAYDELKAALDQLRGELAECQESLRDEKRICAGTAKKAERWQGERDSLAKELTECKAECERLSKGFIRVHNEKEALKAADIEWSEDFYEIRTKAGNLQAELAATKALASEMAGALKAARDKLKIYRANTDGTYQGGMEFAALMAMIVNALSEGGQS